MKKLIDNIKLDRLIDKFLDNLISCGSGGFDYLYMDKKIFFCNMYKNKMVLRTYVFEHFCELKYNRYVHNKIVEFVGVDYDYVLFHNINESENVITIEEYETIISEN